MKLKKVGALCAFLTIATLGTEAESWRDHYQIIMQPEAKPWQISIAKTDDKNIEVVWPSELGIGYIIEYRSNFNTHWQSWAMDSGVGMPMVRKAEAKNETTFYKALRGAVFKTDEDVVWQMQLPDIKQDQLTGSIAVWKFDQEPSVHTRGLDILKPIRKRYHSPGVKFVNTEIYLPDNRILIKDWAVTITDGDWTEPNDPTIKTNLITNGDFEKADTANPSMPQGWRKGGYGDNVRNHEYGNSGISGTKGASVTIGAYASGDAKWYFDDVNVAPNGAYSYGNTYRADTETVITIQYLLKNGDLGYKWLTNLPPSTDWNTWSVEFTTPIEAEALTVFHSLTKSGNLIIDNALLLSGSSTLGTDPDTPAEKTGMISFNFDDGWNSTWKTVEPILKEANMLGTFYIVTERVGREGVVELSDLLLMKEQGHEVAAHGISHIDLVNVDQAKARDEIFGSRDQLKNWGFPQSTFAYPFGSYNSSLIATLKDAGFIAARGTNGGLNDGNTDSFALQSRSLRSTTGLPQIKEWIDQAENQKNWLILVFHNVNYTDTINTITPEVFSEIIDYVKTTNLKVVTTSGGAELLTP